MTEKTEHVEAPECGRLLKRTRERLGLSLDDVAADLRLSPFQIQALEEDDWERLPGITYARGYVRSYARLLDLDAEKLLEGATTEELKIPPAGGSSDDAEETGAAGTGRRAGGGSAVTWIGGLVVVILAAVWFWRSEEASRLMPEVNTGEAPAVEASADSAAATGEAAATADDEQAAVQPAGTTETNGEKPLPEGWRRVVFRFDEPSWVDLRDARGERILYRSFQAGRRIEVEGEPPFRVYLGNAGGVQVEYSGQSISPDPRAGTLYARFVLGAPSG